MPWPSSAGPGHEARARQATRRVDSARIQNVHVLPLYLSCHDVIERSTAYLVPRAGRFETGSRAPAPPAPLPIRRLTVLVSPAPGHLRISLLSRPARLC